MLKAFNNIVFKVFEHWLFRIMRGSPGHVPSKACSPRYVERTFCEYLAAGCVTWSILRVEPVYRNATVNFQLSSKSFAIVRSGVRHWIQYAPWRLSYRREIRPSENNALCAATVYRFHVSSFGCEFHVRLATYLGVGLYLYRTRFEMFVRRRSRRVALHRGLVFSTGLVDLLPWSLHRSITT